MQLRGSSELQLLPRITRLTQAHLERPQLSACNSADLLQLLTSFARVSFQPEDAWLEDHEACAARLARQGLLTPAAAAGMLNGYKGLRFYPHALVGVLKGMMAELQEQRQRQRQMERRREERLLLANER